MRWDQVALHAQISALPARAYRRCSRRGRTWQRRPVDTSEESLGNCEHALLAACDLSRMQASHHSCEKRCPQAADEPRARRLTRALCGQQPIWTMSRPRLKHCDATEAFARPAPTAAWQCGQSATAPTLARRRRRRLHVRPNRVRVRFARVTRNQHTINMQYIEYKEYKAQHRLPEPAALETARAQPSSCSPEGEACCGVASAADLARARETGHECSMLLRHRRRHRLGDR